jgi:hypothetical protein
MRGPAARAGGDPRSGGNRAGARGARADRGGGRSGGVPGTAGCGRGRCRRRRRCGVTVWGEVAVAGRSRRGSGVLARRGRGGMEPGIGARGRLRPGGRGARRVKDRAGGSRVVRDRCLDVLRASSCVWRRRGAVRARGAAVAGGAADVARSLTASRGAAHPWRVKAEPAGRTADRCAVAAGTTPASRRDPRASRCWATRRTRRDGAPVRRVRLAASG